MIKKVMAALFALCCVMFVAVPASACDYECGPGVGTPGYWKNHPEAWPVTEIVIGAETYTKAEAIEWLKAPVKGDKSITLFKAYVAAYLNLEIGNCGDCILDPPEEGQPGWPTPWFDQAYDWLVARPVGSGVRANSEAWQYSHGELVYWMLDAYNNGKLCAASRD